jgi:uroporphyrinogen decarboxylase
MAHVKSILQALSGKSNNQIPIWLMRQAGRYLPEYRKIRANSENFLDLCYSPKLASEVTLQPIRRFGFDAAILFSDILVIPDALGQKVSFLQGEGPCLEPITDVSGYASFQPEKVVEYLAPVMETVSLVRSALDEKTALIGFCGAPWTVATYMVSGKGTKDQAEPRVWAYRDPGGFSGLIDILVESSILYLKAQIEAGAEVLQIFDTWAGSLAESEREKWCLKPVEKIAAAIKKDHPNIPIIAFLRGAPSSFSKLKTMSVIDCIGVDTSVPADFAVYEIAGKKCVQGNLDPLALLAGGDALDLGCDHVLEVFGNSPFIFNLGHGILPETPIAHVERLLEKVRSFR